MEIKFKTKDEIESIALHELRKSSNKKLLSNTNVDCFISGWNAASNDIRSQMTAEKLKEFREYLKELSEYCDERMRRQNEDLGYSGYMYTVPSDAQLIFELWKRVGEACETISANLENVKMSRGEYYDKVKGCGDESKPPLLCRIHGRPMKEF